MRVSNANKRHKDTRVLTGVLNPVIFRDKLLLSASSPFPSLSDASAECFNRYV